MFKSHRPCHSLSTVHVVVSEEHRELSQIRQLFAKENITLHAVDKLATRGAHGAHYHLCIEPISDDKKSDKLAQKISSLEGVYSCEILDATFEMHLGGKITTTPTLDSLGREDLAKVYTPGVARVCERIHQDPESAFRFTIRRNTVAIVTDGSAILGLGDLGPAASLPVMEGKAMLFKLFGGVDAFPICLDTQDVDEIVAIVKAMAPTFGGVNLEDIAAPRCFEIERRLKESLDIPVFHDDQHGTAVVVLAALINALKLVNKKPEEVRVVINGAGAAGTACMLLMKELGIKHIVGCDSRGILHRNREDLNAAKMAFVHETNPDDIEGKLSDAVVGADVFLGVSAPNVLSVKDLKRMSKDPIVFALANPTPEIMPEKAKGHVAVMATGRSDYPNQINNLLAFPGLFRGALDCRAHDITNEMLMTAAKAIADVVSPEELNENYIIPSVFNEDVAPRVAEAVKALMDHD
mgnify:CR=1 FL=1